MPRAESARSKISDDIPLAKRASAYRNPVLRGGKRIWLFIFLFLFLIILFLFRLYTPSIDPSIATDISSSSSSKDRRLLGHFPYKEASLESLVEVYPGLSLHRDTYSELKQMRSAASADGIQLVLLSGFRSIDLQRQIFYGRKSARNQIAIERAKVSAPPGYSEHSTGYAIDLGDATRRETDFEVSFENTPAFQWLKNNAARYHFVMSFPKGNSQGVSFEPWHWRYEGTVEALEEFAEANEKLRIQRLKN